MKVPLHVVLDRREKLAAWLQQRSYVPLNEVCTRFRISQATARRDLAVLANGHQILRTHGGALAEYNHRFPSFLERQRVAAEGKRRIALQARKLIRPAIRCFFDAGTTIFAIAEELHRSPVTPVTAITNSLPVAELLASVEGIRVHMLGGELLRRQSVLVGKAAQKALDLHDIDIAFLGAQGVNDAGAWNSQEQVVQFQKRLMDRARRSILCVDATKLGRNAPAFLAQWTEITMLLTDAKPGDAKAAGVPARILAQKSTPL